MSNSLQNNTPQVYTQRYSSLIGTPYSKRDCWGITVDFYKLVFDITLNDYYSEIPKDRDIAKNLIYSNIGDFTQVEDRKFGDIILIKMFGVESHIAVYLGEGRILHTEYKSGCVIDRLARWEKMIVGFYRIKQ